VASYGSIGSANLNRVDVTLPGESERRMTGVALKEGELLVSQLLHLRRQICVELPEGLERYRLGLTHADGSL